MTSFRFRDVIILAVGCLPDPVIRALADLQDARRMAIAVPRRPDPPPLTGKEFEELLEDMYWFSPFPYSYRAHVRARESHEFRESQRLSIPRPLLRNDSAPRDRRRPRATEHNKSLDFG